MVISNRSDDNIPIAVTDSTSYNSTPCDSRRTAKSGSYLLQ